MIYSVDIRIAIIKKMVRMRLWGAKHTSIDNIPKGFPSHLRSEVKSEVQKLIREGYIIPKPTAYGLELSLNPSMKKEISEIIESL
ncbi:MAG: hypothetical protein U9Q92_00460 [archaeon]|nr:hypothetical protein [archaeon]